MTPPAPSSVPPDTSPWIRLAHAALDRWENDGAIELEPDGDRAAFVDALADHLASDPSAADLEEWLIDHDTVAEVFADGGTLHTSLAGMAERLSAGQG